MLAFQARQGSVQARERLRHLLLPGIALIVRHTLRTGIARTELARQVFHECRRVKAQFPDRAAALPGALVDFVTRRMADQLLAGLRDKPLPADLARETVVA
jgi:hypothetical protein